MTVTPSCSTGSPNTFFTVIASLAPLSMSSTLTISLSFEVGLSLLAERPQALAGVAGGEGEVEQAPLILEAELERPFVGAVDRLLRKPRRHGPLRGDVARDPLCLLEPRLARDHAGDESRGERLARAQDHVHRERLADRTREPLRASRTGNDPERRLGLAELRRLRGDDQVAGHRQLAAAAEAEAGHRCHERW